MKIPPNHTEQEVWAIIEKILNILAPKYIFGYYDLEDIKQHGRLCAISLLNKEKYDSKRSLGAFLYTHIKHRLINLRRDKFSRNDPPCRRCYDGFPCKDGQYCDGYEHWLRLNKCKNDLMKSAVDTTPADNIVRNNHDDTIEIIRGRLPQKYQADFVRLLDGQAISAKAKKEIAKIVEGIL